MEKFDKQENKKSLKTDTSLYISSKRQNIWKKINEQWGCNQFG